MARSNDMSLTSRHRALKKLILDAEELGFSKKVIDGYKSELAEVETQQKEIKAERERFNSNGNI